MPSITESLLGKQALWHATSRENADAIRIQGFHPMRKSGQHRHRQATWFYHVTSFIEGGVNGPDVGLVLSVDLSEYERGRDYIHEMANTVVFKVPLSPDGIVAAFDLPATADKMAIVNALRDHCQGDLIDDLETCCCDPEIPWSAKRSISEMLWTLAPRRYLDANVLCRMLASEASGLDLDRAERQASLLREDCPVFLNSLLGLYHRTFLTPRLARATMISAARVLGPSTILALAEGSSGASDSDPEAAAVATFVRAVLPVLPVNELVRGAIEMASMRHFPGKDEDIQEIGEWVAKRAGEAEDVAFHYVRFAGDSYPARHAANVARRLAVRVLFETGGDYYDRLLALGDTDDLEALSGVTHAFAELRDRRAVPFLASRIRDTRKGPRMEAATALGKIGTPDALAAVRTIANDKRRVVRNAVRAALKGYGQ